MSTAPDVQSFVDAAHGATTKKLVWSGADMLSSLAEYHESAPLPSGECDSGRVASDDGSSILKLPRESCTGDLRLRNSMLTMGLRAMSMLLAMTMAMIAATPDFLMRGRRLFIVGPATALMLLLALGCAGAVNVDVNSLKPNKEPCIGRDAMRALESAMKGGSSPQPYCNMDTGTSKPASGRRSLFPTALITDKNPDISVRVASGSRMAVGFVGVAVLRLKEPVGIFNDGSHMYLTLEW